MHPRDVGKCHRIWLSRSIVSLPSAPGSRYICHEGASIDGAFIDGEDRESTRKNATNALKEPWLRLFVIFLSLVTQRNLCEW